MSKKTPQQVGKQFENDVQRALENLQNTRRLVVHRFYDSTSAGSLLPAQPGDMMIVNKGVTTLIECKSSAKHPTLCDRRAPLTDLFSKNQVMKMRLWRRAGAYVLVPFLDQVSGNFELANGYDVAMAYVEKRRLAQASVNHLNDFDTMISIIMGDTV